MGNGLRRSIPALVAASALATACGAGTDAGGPPTMVDDPHGHGDVPRAQADTPGPWAPSRVLLLDRFALETALGVSLTGPAGDELRDSTRWTLTGGDVELRFEVRTWFNRAEAEVRCRSAAGDQTRTSLALGTPTWTGPDSVFLTRAASCVGVRVTRGGRTDLSGAAAVARVIGRAG